MSLGSTWHVPEADKFLVSKEELMDDVTALLGGRVAEEIVYNKVWTGASNDLERVTRISRAMVCEYGMSEKLGTLALGRRSHNPFLGRDYNDERNYSEDVARQIDEEVRDIVDKSHRRATDILLEHRPQLDGVVQALLERETLNREDFLAVMAGETLPALEIPTTPSDDGEPAEGKETDKSRKPTIAPPRFEPGPA
jgi:cell division protease FtsH